MPDPALPVSTPAVVSDRIRTGSEVKKADGDRLDPELFRQRLRHGVTALAELLERPRFGLGERSVGSELELFLIDRDGRPFGINQEVRAEAHDPRVQVEFDRFNIEVNPLPAPLAGRPFSFLREQLTETMTKVREAATPFGARAVAVGILPTLRRCDLDAAITDLPRYQAIRREFLRHELPPISIEGEESLSLKFDDVTLEGAATGFQLHLRVDPSDFARAYNAAQIAVAPALAASGNSPILLGRVLWEETRVALLRQWVDHRLQSHAGWCPAARVSFGHSWIHTSALELFRECVALYPPLLPILGAETDALETVRRGGVPSLDELRLHQSTVWRWNRVVYDPTLDGGHLRIEIRALPAGPSIPDMLANSAFLFGLILALMPDVDELTAALPFEHARYNFHAAARHGLGAELLWPEDPAPSPRPIRAVELIRRLVPLARQGLAEAGVATEESEPLLEIFTERCARGVTGARWQRRRLAELERDRPREEALAAMLEHYCELADTGLPVHCWPLGA